MEKIDNQNECLLCWGIFLRLEIITALIYNEGCRKDLFPEEEFI